MVPLLVVQSLAVELVLVVDDEVVGAIGEGDDGRVWETPAEAPCDSDGECQLVVLSGELLNINDRGVEAGDLLQSDVFRLVLLLVLHDLRLQKLVLQEVELLLAPEAWEVTLLCDLEVWVPETPFAFAKLIGHEEDEPQVLGVCVLIEDVVVPFNNEGQLRGPDLVLVDDQLVGDVEVGFLRADLALCGYAQEVP